MSDRAVAPGRVASVARLVATSRLDDLQTWRPCRGRRPLGGAVRAQGAQYDKMSGVVMDGRCPGPTAGSTAPHIRQGLIVFIMAATLCARTLHQEILDGYGNCFPPQLTHW